MRRFVNLVIAAMVLYGLYQFAPLIRFYFGYDTQVVPAHVVVFDLIPEAGGYRPFIIYEYVIETQDARKEVLASALADSVGKVITPPLLSKEQAAAYLPLLEDPDEIAEKLPKPLVFVDAQDPLHTARMYYFLSAYNRYDYALLFIALPLLIWLSGLLIRSFIAARREPVANPEVKLEPSAEPLAHSNV